MIYSKIIFPITQRIFWKKVRKRKKEWEKIITEKNECVKKIISDNLTFILHKDDLLSELIYCENFEWAEKEWLKNYLKPGMVFYDIGANVGFYTLIAAQQVSPNGRVYAIEPSKKTFNRLSKNIEANPSLQYQIHPYEIAVSDKKGETQIYVSDTNLHAWNSLAKPTNLNDFKTETIQTETLDALFENNKWLAPNLIKIDVEGWELHALNGAQKMIEKHHPAILIEFTKENLERTGTNYATLKNNLTEMGYDLYEYLPRCKMLSPIINWDFEHKNIIALKK